MLGPAQMAVAFCSERCISTAIVGSVRIGLVADPKQKLGRSCYQQLIRPPLRENASEHLESC